MTFFVELGAVRCDTSSLPDTATVQPGCFVRIKTDTEAISSADARNITMAWADAEVPWSNADYDVNAGTNAHAGTLLTSISPNTVVDFALSNCAANIDVDGFTGLKIWVDGGQPTGSNLLNFLPSSPSPQLIFTYQP